MTASWLTWAFLSACFAAMTAICAKIGIDGINSDQATFFRTIVIVVVLGVILAATGKFQPLSTISLKSWTFLTLSGLATGASWVCYFRALQLGDASKVAPIDKLSVVMVAIIAAVVLGERLSITGWTGVGFIALGAALVAIA